MKLKLFIFSLSLLAYIPCYAKQIIVVSVGGASDREVHEVVSVEKMLFGYSRSGTSAEYNAALIAIARRREARELRDIINGLVSRNGGDKSNLSLLLVGKSAGAIQIWNVVKRQYDHFDDFHRVALVLIDPHGAAYGDGKSGPYNSSQDLWWPSTWSSDRDFLRVYNIYQQRFPGAGGGLTGASFPDPRVVQNTEITESGVDHTNIPEHRQSRATIQSALLFACMPRAETGITKPFDISVQNLVGRNTVNARRPVTFSLNNFTCDCSRSSVHVFKGDGNQIHTFNNIQMEQNVTYRPPSGVRKLYFQAACGSGINRRVTEKSIFLDYEPPTFDSIKVTPNTRREGSMVLYANRVRDDGYWDGSDYQIQVTIDSTRNYSGSGTGITINDLSDGNHSATMRISDGLGRWSDSKTTTFPVSTARPIGRFITPASNIPISRGSNLTVVFIAGHPSGIMRVDIYLNRISEDEFDFTKICTIPGDFGIGQPEQRACPPIPTVSSGSLDWRPGPHRLIAVIKDNSGNETTVETVVQIR